MLIRGSFKDADSLFIGVVNSYGYSFSRGQGDGSGNSYGDMFDFEDGSGYGKQM